MVLRKTSRPAPTPVDLDENIDPGLLDHIPDVAAPHVPFEVEAVTQPPPDALLAGELQGLLGQLQTELQAVLADEFTRVETGVAHLFSDLEARLAEANALVEQLSEENAQLIHAKDRYERAFHMLKELTRDVEETA